MVKGQFFILTQAVFFNDPYCSFLLDNYYCSIGPILASFFFKFQKNDYKKTKEKNVALGFILALVVWIFFVNDMEDFLSAFHTHFSLKYKCKIKNWVDVVCGDDVGNS